VENTEIAISFLTHQTDPNAPLLFIWWLAWTDEVGGRLPLWTWGEDEILYSSEKDVRDEIAKAQEVDPELALIPIASEVGHYTPPE
jgi:hypothetical protein